MIIEHGQNLEIVIEKVIIDEMRDIIKRNPDVFTPSMLKIIDVVHMNQREWMWENYFRRYEGDEIPREYIRESFENFSQNRSMMCSTYLFCPDDNNKVRLEYLSLNINTDELILFCFYHIHEFDKLIDDIKKMTVRHEMGHMMHYISWEGKPAEDVIQEHENYNKDLKDYYEWRKGCDDPKQFLKKYYEIPNEAIANELGNVSVEDIIAFDLYDDKDIDLEINVKERSGNFYDY